MTGDNKKLAAAWRKLNAIQRSGQGDLFTEFGIPVGNTRGRAAAQEIATRAASAQTLADVAWASQRYDVEQTADHTVQARRVADAWSAAFLGGKTDTDLPITHSVLEQLGAGTAPAAVVEAVDTIAACHRLFHWHLEFPDVFDVADDGPANTATGWTGGFSAMLGNPPWERIKLQEQEFFASRDSAIAEAKNAAARKKAILALADSHPELLAEFNAAKRQSEAESHFIRTSGRYPLCGVGDVNTYSVFAEHFRSVIDADGFMGIIVPTGIVTDATTQAFAREATPYLRSLLDFRNNGFFEGVASAQGVRFCLLRIHVKIT